MRDRLDSEALIEYWQGFHLGTLARINLSFVPLVEMLDRNSVAFRDAASFGSGSCTHEVALALLSDAQVHCFDATDKYIPEHTRSYLDRLPHVHFQIFDFTRPPDRDFDLVFSIQTLEHIEDYESAMDDLVRAVRPGGHLYIDTPVFHEEPEREPNIDAHHERAWRNNEHYHLGFSRQRMIERLANRGMEPMDSGYYSYAAGDHALMQYVRESERGQAQRADPGSIQALSRGLWTALAGCERAYAPMRDQIDSLLLRQRVCFAYRILVRRPIA